MRPAMPRSANRIRDDELTDNDHEGEHHGHDDQRRHHGNRKDSTLEDVDGESATLCIGELPVRRPARPPRRIRSRMRKPLNRGA
jgi:hypothetical protein